MKFLYALLALFALVACGIGTTALTPATPTLPFLPATTPTLRRPATSLFPTPGGVVPTVGAGPTETGAPPPPPPPPPPLPPLSPTPTLEPPPPPPPPPTASPTTVIAPGVYVTALRVSPPDPHRGLGMAFFATFLNTTGAEKGFRWRVEIWRTEPTKNSFGITDGKNRTIPTGSNELDTTGDYKVTGIAACLPLRARVISEDDEMRRTPFTKPDGSELWLEFQVCP